MTRSRSLVERGVALCKVGFKVVNAGLGLGFEVCQGLGFSCLASGFCGTRSGSLWWSGGGGIAPGELLGF